MNLHLSILCTDKKRENESSQQDSYRSEHFTLTGIDLGCMHTPEPIIITEALLQKKDEGLLLVK